MGKHVVEADGNFIELPYISEEELATRVAQVLDENMIKLEVETAFPADAATLFERQEGEA